MRSVKDLLVDAPPGDGTGRGRFRFRDDYSVFDWGEMPDRVPGKGASLCTTGAHTFELLADEGVPTHYRGVIPPGENGEGDESTPEPVSLDELSAPPREMAIDLARVPELPHDGREYDYDAYHDAGGDAYVVPLEIVFRNVVPAGSSLRRRTDPADHGLEFGAWPDRAVELPEPIVEFSTKYEDGDRYLDRAAADRIAGAADLDELERVAREVNRTITKRAAAAGFDHQDGKIECVHAGGEVVVADVAGTFDENRFAYDGVQVSKEVLRQYYRRTQPDWVAAVEEAKATARERDHPDWKALCEATPDPLPADVVTAVADLYAAGANAYAGRALFDAPAIEDAVDRVREL